LFTTLAWNLRGHFKSEPSGKNESSCSLPYGPVRRSPVSVTPLAINRPKPFLVVVRKAESPPRAAKSGTSEPAIFHRGDFVLLTDDMECSMVGTEDISLLEAHRKFTLVHLPDGKFLVRRSLKDCERRLDSSTFFRASSGYIVNLSHVKQSRFLEDGSLVFILRDGKEVVLGRRQSALFRKTHGL
jgi:DNA-binding LytR/AlgR family response regulator